MPSGVIRPQGQLARLQQFMSPLVDCVELHGTVGIAVAVLALADCFNFQFIKFLLTF